MTKFTLNTNKKLIVTPYTALIEQTEDQDGRMLYLPITDSSYAKNKCPFLRDDYKCNIYQNRPWICRKFGEPGKDSSIFLHCGWLDGKYQTNVIDNGNDADAFLIEALKELTKGKLR